MNDKVELIRQHILSYNPSITHYRRKHAPNRFSFSPVHSTASKDFNETYNTNISKSRYYKEIKDMNISFVKLDRKDKERWNGALNDAEYIVSADLQKVIMLPILPGLKKAIFCKRIVMFNETFAPLGGSKNGKPIGKLWHDGISGRNAEDVASVFLTYLRKFENIDETTIWLDNCSAQAKNWWLFTCLVYEVNRRNGNYEIIT